METDNKGKFVFNNIKKDDNHNKIKKRKLIKFFRIYRF